MNLASIARNLGGEVAGRDRILCPGPGHSRNDRSLSIVFKGADTFAVYSHAGDDWRACKDHVRAAVGLSGWKAGDGQPRRDRQILLDPEVAKLEAERTARAVALWHGAVPIAGTRAEAYLARRGLAYSGEALRWHKACPFSEGQRLGCMIALVRNVRTDREQAVHRTALRPESDPLFHRALDRKAFGPIGGGAAKLTDDADVTLTLGLGEGIESSISIQRLPDLASLPVWAALTADGVASFPVLAGIQSFWLGLDNDLAGNRATRALGGRLHDAGAEVIMLAPRAAGADLNDGVRVNA